MLFPPRIEELYDAGAPRAKLNAARAVIRMMIKSLVMARFVKWLKSLENEVRSTQRVRGVLGKTRGVRPAEELAPKEEALLMVKSTPQPPVDHRKETFICVMVSKIDLISLQQFSVGYTRMSEQSSGMSNSWQYLAGKIAFSREHPV